MCSPNLAGTTKPGWRGGCQPGFASPLPRPFRRSRTERRESAPVDNTPAIGGGVGTLYSIISYMDIKAIQKKILAEMRVVRDGNGRLLGLSCEDRGFNRALFVAVAILDEALKSPVSNEVIRINKAKSPHRAILSLSRYEQ